VTLEQLGLDELRRFSDRFGDDVHGALTVEASLRARAVVGGTAPEAVWRSLACARALVERPDSPATPLHDRDAPDGP
jgi:argininosuccinate lyase